LRLSISTGAIQEGGTDTLPVGTHCVRVCVTDSGTGIDPAVLPRIFEPFFSTKPREEGTGLGLSLVHGIVADHGGRIEVESRIGEGTTFMILLPTWHPETTAQGESRSMAAGARELILVGGPDSFQVGAIGGYLQSIGYRVLLAADEDQALGHLGQHGDEVQLVILRSDLPHHGAPTCIQKCREKHRNLPAILLPGELPMSHESLEENDLVLDGPLVLGELARLVKGAINQEERTEP
jgi:CheY-like chemotaxis protein